MKIQNEAELLNKFCDAFYNIPLLRTPFLNTEYNEVWSTNGYVFIGINPEILAKEYPKGKHPFPKLEFPCEKTITIEALNKAFNSCPMVDEEIVVEDAVKCEECDGSGTVYWEYTDSHLNTHERLMDCPICDGEGEIEPCKTKKTGKKIIEEDTVVEVGNAHIFANRLQLLKIAMEFLNVDTVKMTHNDPKGANEFIISKDIRVIIMPMLFDYSFTCSAKLELVD
jgi:hypothetical protein